MARIRVVPASEITAKKGLRAQDYVQKEKKYSVSRRKQIVILSASREATLDCERFGEVALHRDYPETGNWTVSDPRTGLAFCTHVPRAVAVRFAKWCDKHYDDLMRLSFLASRSTESTPARLDPLRGRMRAVRTRYEGKVW